MPKHNNPKQAEHTIREMSNLSFKNRVAFLARLLDERDEEPRLCPQCGSLHG